MSNQSRACRSLPSLIRMLIVVCNLCLSLEFRFSGRVGFCEKTFPPTNARIFLSCTVSDCQATGSAIAQVIAFYCGYFAPKTTFVRKELEVFERLVLGHYPYCRASFPLGILTEAFKNKSYSQDSGASTHHRNWAKTPITTAAARSIGYRGLDYRPRRPIQYEVRCLCCLLWSYGWLPSGHWGRVRKLIRAFN